MILVIRGWVVKGGVMALGTAKRESELQRVHNIWSAWISAAWKLSGATIIVDKSLNTNPVPGTEYTVAKLPHPIRVGTLGSSEIKRCETSDIR